MTTRVLRVKLLLLTLWSSPGLSLASAPALLPSAPATPSSGPQASHLGGFALEVPSAWCTFSWVLNSNVSFPRTLQLVPTCNCPFSPHFPLPYIPKSPSMSGSSDLSLLCPQGPGQCGAGTRTWEYAQMVLPVLTTRGRPWVRNKCLETTQLGPRPQGEVSQTGHRRRGSGPL